MKKTVIFYFLCLITVFLFFCSLFLINKAKPYITPIYNTMNVILDVQKNSPEDIIIKINDNYSELPNSKNVLNKTITGKVNSIDILIKEGFKNKIKDIVVFNDVKVHYFKDFSNFEKEEIELCPLGNCAIYTKYKIPNTVKYNKNSKTYNYRSHINTFCCVILTLFSGHFALFIPYILLFISIIYFINNREEIKKPKLNPYFLTGIIFIFGILSYSNGIFDYLPWDDEYRTLDYSDPDKSIITAFKDICNPPLFYILFRYFAAIFGVSQLTMKVFPFIFSILFSVVLWMFLNKKFNGKIATMGVFLAFINIPLIYFAQETRSYIMQAFMSVVIIYYLFEILEKNKKKDYIIYGIITALASNLHYYEVLLLVSNFIYAAFYMLFQKRYKDILKFFLANLTGGLFLLPFLLPTVLSGALSSPSTQSWFPDINYFQIKRCVFYIFGGGVSFLISAAIFIKNIFEKEKNQLLIYSFFVIFSVIFLAVILSYTIKPMLVERYLVLLIPLFIIFTCSVFANYNKNKYAVIFFIIWVLLIQSGSFEKANRKKALLEMPLSFSKQYIESNKDKNVYAIVNLPNLKYFENKDKFIDNDIRYVESSSKVTEEKIKNILEKNKNALIFTNILNPKAENNYTCYFNSASDMCLWRIEND